MRHTLLLKSIFIFGLVLILAAFAPIGSKTAFAAESSNAKLNVDAQTIVRGKTFALHVYNLSEEATVTYRSSTPAVASVTSEGLVKGLSIGTTTITVYVFENNKSVATLSCKITVGPPALAVGFVMREVDIAVGDKLTLARIIQPLSTAESPKFYSYDSSISSVSAGGRITAKSTGTTWVFALLDNARYDVCRVNVVPDESYLKTEDEILEEGNLLTDEFGSEDAMASENVLQSSLKAEPAETETGENGIAVNAAVKVEGTDTETQGAVVSEEVKSDPLDIVFSWTKLDYDTFIKKLDALYGTLDAAVSN